MLAVAGTIDDDAVERLFGVYAESMGDLSVEFSSEREMRSSYRGFLEDFVSDQGRLVLVEEDDGVWKSALRAVSCGGGRWFIEAVETDPGARRHGYGRLLLLHVAGHLRSLGAKEMTCCVHGDNEASIRLHESCGFKATDESPVNPWGSSRRAAFFTGSICEATWPLLDVRGCRAWMMLRGLSGGCSIPS